MLDEHLYSDYPYYGAETADDIHYDPAKPRIKDILWYNYDWILELEQIGKLRPEVLECIQKTLLCNTVYLGYDYYECPHCGNFNIIYHKCHSRFCTSCGVKLQKHLAAKAESMCVDVNHRHLVFTIPEPYRLLFRYDRSALNLLFVAARNTLAKMFNESLYRKEKRKLARKGKIRNDKDNYYLYRNFRYQNIFGMIATLHTFGRDLKWNPHIHALVPEVVFNSKTKKIKKVDYFPYENLRKTWQYELNRLLLDHFGKNFRKYMNKSYAIQNEGYYVYAPPIKNEDGKPVSDHVEGCVNYMMRYAARPAMAQSRITSYNKETNEVEWFYDDHKTEERIIVRESAQELLKKMFIHIPDKHFRMVRYYGFYNPKEQDILDEIHKQLGQKTAETKKKATKESRRKLLRFKQKKLKFRTLCLDSYNRDILRCSCGEIMVYKFTDNPLEGDHNDRQYREKCINEMRALWLRRRSPHLRS